MTSDKEYKCVHDWANGAWECFGCVLLRNELEITNAERMMLIDDKEVLRKKLDIAIEALEFYISQIICSDDGCRYWTDKGINDHGDKAKEALEKIK